MKTASINYGCMLLLLTGCVSPRVVTPPKAGVNFREYRTVKVLVTDAVNTSYSKEGRRMLEGLLKGKLQSLGHQVVEVDPQMILEVEVRAFDPGDRAMRMIVGFGAGRAVLKFAARFKDESGKVLAAFEGGKSYHGMELVDNPTFKSDESTRLGMISQAVKEIGEFIHNNGRLYAHKYAPRGSEP